MSDYPCTECGVEGRGPFAHSAKCSQQQYRRPAVVCPLCQNWYLYKDQKFCDICSKDPEIAKPLPKRFKVVRFKDHSGVSGVGHVADGVQFWTGQVVVVWRGDTSSTNLFSSLENFEEIHGHEGSTQVVWVDEN